MNQRLTDLGYSANGIDSENCHSNLIVGQIRSIVILYQQMLESIKDI